MASFLPLIAFSPRSRLLTAGLVLFLAVVLVYAPTYHAGYLWDDDKLLTENVSVVGSRGLEEVWTTKAADICPLTITILRAGYCLWGLAPLPYHLLGVLLHAISALLLWRVLRRLRVPGAWLGAALWALHPVQVESVAWVSEIKNTLSGVFYLSAVLWFLRWLASPRAWVYALTLLCAFLAMAGKTSAMVLPGVLCLLAWWVDGRWRWRRLREIGPVFLLAFAAGALSVWTQAATVQSYTGPQRLAAAGDAVWFYLGKLAWPHPLLAVYPRWEMDVGQPWVFLPTLAVLLAGMALWLTRSRAVLLAGAYFLGVLLPVLGIASISYYRHSFVADHFVYLASMGPLALAAAGIASWRKEIVGMGLLLVLGMVSWQRAGVYRNEETLWTDTLAKDPRSLTARVGLAQVRELQGRTGEAVGLYRAALDLDPGNVESCNRLGNLLLHHGAPDEAIRLYQRAVDDHPGDPASHINFGNGLVAKNRLDDAIVQYQAALDLNPRLVAARSGLGNALVRKGRLDDGVAQFRAALALDPGRAALHDNLALALARSGRTDEANSQFQQALKIDPGDAAVRYNFGIALFSQGRTDEAVAEFQEALRLKPGYHEAQEALAAVTGSR